MGDWVIATAQVKQLNEKTGQKVVVVGRNGRPQWHVLFDNNPRIVRAPGRGTVTLINGPGVRPYIVSKTAEKWTWKRWEIAPGEIYLSVEERAFAEPYGGYILIEPNTKLEGSNKSYEWSRWVGVVARFPAGTFIQIGPPQTKRLEGVKFVETPTFRHACAVLSVSRAFVGAEGGLGHAAAAFGIRAVVLFSDFIAPAVTGYPSHINIHYGTSELGCGNRVIPCQGCREAMEKITVNEVEASLRSLID